MSRLTYLIALAIVCTTVQAVSQPENYYATHSAPITVTRTAPLTRDMYGVIVDEHHYLHQTTSPIKITDLADVTTRSLGSDIVTSSFSSASLLASSPFHHAKLNVQLNIESVGKTILETIPVTHMLSPVSRHISFDITSSSISPPQSSVTIAANLATGTTPNKHGVVGASWKQNGKLVHAYSNIDTEAQRATVADVLAQSFDGQSFTLSASANEQLAKAFSTNTRINQKHPEWNNVAVTYDSASKSFKSSSTHFPVYNTNTLESSLKQLFSTLSGKVTATVNGHIVTISYVHNEQSRTVEFNLHKEVDRLFFAEFQYMITLPSLLSSTSYIQTLLTDSVPDSITLTFTSFTSLINTYGRASDKTIAAFYLFDSLLPSIQSSYATLSSHSMFQIIYMGSHASVLDTSDVRDVIRTIERVTGVSDVATTFPQVYITTPVITTCQALEKSLSSHGYSVSCPSAQNNIHTTSFVEMADPTPVPTGGYYYADAPTTYDVQRYQIVLWLSIGLVLAAIAAVYSLAFMSNKQDTMLYSSFNPNWDSKRR